MALRTSFIALLIGAIIGSALGWTACFVITNAQTAQAESGQRKVIEANAFRVIGEDGKICMSLNGWSITSADGNARVFGSVDFYNAKGEITQKLGTMYNGAFFIESYLHKPRIWSLYEPNDKFIYVKP